MTIEKLNYLLTGTEQPRGVTTREKTIIAECAKIITDIEQLQQGGVVRPALDSSDGGELLPASDGEANMRAGCCDHVEWVVRLGILQCANCGKPN